MVCTTICAGALPALRSPIAADCRHSRNDKRGPCPSFNLPMTVGDGSVVMPLVTASWGTRMIWSWRRHPQAPGDLVRTFQTVFNTLVRQDDRHQRGRLQPIGSPPNAPTPSRAMLPTIRCSSEQSTNSWTNSVMVSAENGSDDRRRHFRAAGRRECQCRAWETTRNPDWSMARALAGGEPLGKRLQFFHCDSSWLAYRIDRGRRRAR
jgi:hypothetical protein